MADHSKPTSESIAANFAAEIDARIDDITLWLDPATTTPTNIPVGAKAWDSAAKKWKKWTGTAWADLESTYAIAISGNAGTATKLATARTVTLDGAVSGSASFDGSSNLTITAAVEDDSHAHVIANVDGLDAALAAKLDDSDATSTPTASKIPVASASGVLDAGWNDPRVAREIRLQALAINPTLDLDFSRQRYSVYDGAKGLAEIADPWANGFFTFARATSKTYVDARGALVTAPSGSPVIEYDPETLECLGYAVHPTATNLFLNSNSPATQSITTTAQAYTVSFFGSGTVTLSGAATGSVSGIDSATRSTLTVTASAGSVTVTLSGSVTRPQFEAGYYATPYIETAGVAATRAADALYITGTNFSRWYRGDAGAFIVKYNAKNDVFGTPVVRYALCASDGTNSNQIILFRRAHADTSTRLTITDATVSQAFSYAGVFATSGTLACSYSANNASICQNGGTPVVDAECQIPSCSQLNIGSSQLNSAYLNGHISRILYFPAALTASQIQELTK